MGMTNKELFKAIENTINTLRNVGTSKLKDDLNYHIKDLFDRLVHRSKKLSLEKDKDYGLTNIELFHVIEFLIDNIRNVGTSKLKDTLILNLNLLTSIQLNRCNSKEISNEHLEEIINEMKKYLRNLGTSAAKDILSAHCTEILREQSNRAKVQELVTEKKRKEKKKVCRF